MEGLYPWVGNDPRLSTYIENNKKQESLAICSMNICDPLASNVRITLSLPLNADLLCKRLSKTV